jgi:hypothetical protein
MSYRLGSLSVDLVGLVTFLYEACVDEILAVVEQRERIAAVGSHVDSVANDDRPAGWTLR